MWQRAGDLRARKAGVFCIGVPLPLALGNAFGPTSPAAQAWIERIARLPLADDEELPGGHCGSEPAQRSLIPLVENAPPPPIRHVANQLNRLVIPAL
jgi:hypothetical protein